MLVFISHSSSDNVIVGKIVEELESNGMKCWLSSRDIKPGATWAASIMDGIESSSVMLLVLTKTANSSQQVSREVEEAVRLNIPIVPIIVGEFEVSKNIKYFINSHQWINVPSKLHSDWVTIVIDTLKIQHDAKSTIGTVAEADTSAKRYKDQGNTRKVSKALLLILVTSLAMVLIKTVVFKQSAFISGIQAMESEDYTLAAQLFDDYARTHPEDSLHMTALYNCARASRLAGLQTTGERYLAVVNEYPDEFSSQLALFWAAKFFDSAGMRSEALQVHLRIIQDDSIEIPLRIYSLSVYGDYMYDISAYSNAIALYQECVQLSDSLIHLVPDIDIMTDFRIPEIVDYPAKCAYRIALILISELNYSSVTFENAAQFTDLKIEAETWLAKCLTYNVDDYFMAACSEAVKLNVEYAKAIALISPPEKLVLDSTSVDEYYNVLNDEIYQPSIQNALIILRVIYDKSKEDGIITPSEIELINRSATLIDSHMPGATADLGIPDSVYSSRSYSIGPYSRQMTDLTEYDVTLLPFWDPKSKQTSYPIWVR